MPPLPKPSVDTGAGLERITAILEGKNNNYDTDLFAGIIGKIEEVSGKKYAGGMAVEDAPFRVIADHARAATMLVADGVIPSNEGRGYVLRRIIRRALRYGRRLETKSGFFYQVAQQVPYSLEPYFPTDERKGQVGRLLQQVLLTEETQFSKTMSVGADRVGEAISEARRRGETSLSGPAAFRLYDTHGVPLELIEEISTDEGVSVDRAGFEAEMEKARERSKGASKFEHEGDLPKDGQIDSSWTTEFRGYPEQDFVSLEGAQVLGLFTFRENGLFEQVDKLSAGQKGWVVTDRSIFYPEGGGQVADRGEFLWKSSEGERRAEVIDARRAPNGKTILHLLRISSGSLVPTQLVAMQVP